MAIQNGQLRLSGTSHPIICEVNTRVLLRELSTTLGEAVTLGIIPDAVLDGWASMAFDGVWMMGMWQSGPSSREIALEHDGLKQAYAAALPDWKEDDVAGSPYAIQSYEPMRGFGGVSGLRRLKERLRARGLCLILDFVPNHTSRDHSWVVQHPEYYINGQPGEEHNRPAWFFRAATNRGVRTLGFGRDPFFPGWTDTAQLNIQRADTRQAEIEEMLSVAHECDGLRCDMAMLLNRDIFHKTWEGYLGQDSLATEFWQEATDAVRSKFPNFLFIAEAYWNTEWDLQRMGFDYTYDKVLNDRLLHQGAYAVGEHLHGAVDFQRRCVRFLENHDERPAASAFPSEPWHFAAAVVVATIPGMLLLHEGELQGRTVKLPVQLTRRVEEAKNPRVEAFYRTLLGVVGQQVFRTGEWVRLQPRSAWYDNYSWRDFLSWWWDGGTEGHRLVLVNFSPHSSQCYIDLPLGGMEGPSMQFKDLMGPALYARDKDGLQSKGMFFDLPAYGFHIMNVTSVKSR